MNVELSWIDIREYHRNSSKDRVVAENKIYLIFHIFPILFGCLTEFYFLFTSGRAEPHQNHSALENLCEQSVLQKIREKRKQPSHYIQAQVFLYIWQTVMCACDCVRVNVCVHLYVYEYVCPLDSCFACVDVLRIS